VHKNLLVKPGTLRYSPLFSPFCARFCLLASITKDLPGSSKRKRFDSMMGHGKDRPMSIQRMSNSGLAVMQLCRVGFILLRSEFGRSVQSLSFSNDEILISELNTQDIDIGPLPSLVIPCKAKEVKAPGTRWPGDTKYTYENYRTGGRSGECSCKLNKFNKISRARCNRQLAGE
jgi:hypothetical protein